MKKNQYNKHGQRDGYWGKQWSNGKPAYKCFYDKNGENVGYEEFCYRSGSLSRKEYHIR